MCKQTNHLAKIKKSTYGQIVKVAVHFCHPSHLQLEGEKIEKQKALNLSVLHYLKLLVLLSFLHINERQLFTASAVGYIHKGVTQMGFLCVFVVVIVVFVFLPSNAWLSVRLVWFSLRSHHVILQASVNIALSHIKAES